MDRKDDPEREVEALRERLTRLSEASLRINDSLDFDTVLQGVIDSACALTNASHGYMTVMDESGNFLDESGFLEDFLFHGFTEEEREQLRSLPDNLEIYKKFINVQESMRRRDMRSFVASHGLSFGPVTSRTFIVAPMLHRGTHVGTFFVANKKGDEEFSREDEEVVAMFASQAALVISNARRHQEALRARTDLETLIDTSPVGVVVFDGKTGSPRMFNREATRIVEELRPPDKPPEHLLEIVTVRRADGRELSLQELSMSQALSAAETVRAEEVLVQVPDGQSITVLINVTPIRSEDGYVESCVVTMQDMTQIEELERLRAEFLAMVSHELRTPLSTVRGAVSALMDEFSDMQSVEVRQFHQIIFEQNDRMRELIADLLDVARIETGTLPVTPEPTELAVLAAEAANAFRVRGHQHNLRVEISPDLPWVMAHRSRILQVLGNLLTNAARHSPESSTIRIVAAPVDLHVAVTVSDEGIGISAESLPHLFRKFSRIEREGQGGDTGLGLAVCRGIVEAHGGRIWAESDGPDMGTRFTFTLQTVEEAGFASPTAPPQLDTRSNRRAAKPRVRVLAVEDDPQALKYISEVLVKAGYAAISTGDPDEVLRLVEEERPHVVLLDLMLPGVNGIELMKDIIDARDVPVIFVSAYGQDQLIARAFQMGAEDYVVKPFSPTELVARIGAALRKRRMSEPAVPYVVGDLTIDYTERLVTLRGVPVDLAAIQYRMLVELSSNAGRVVTYESLLRRIWDSEGDGDVRPMRTIISAIRRKLGDDADNPTYIFTEARVGYKMPRGQAEANQKETAESAGQDS